MNVFLITLDPHDTAVRLHRSDLMRKKYSMKVTYGMSTEVALSTFPYHFVCLQPSFLRPTSFTAFHPVLALPVHRPSTSSPSSHFLPFPCPRLRPQAQPNAAAAPVSSAESRPSLSRATLFSKTLRARPRFPTLSAPILRACLKCGNSLLDFTSLLGFWVVYVFVGKLGKTCPRSAASSMLSTVLPCAAQCAPSRLIYFQCRHTGKKTNCMHV